MPYQMYFLFPYAFLSSYWEKRIQDKNKAKHNIKKTTNSEEQKNQTSKRKLPTQNHCNNNQKNQTKNPHRTKQNKPIGTACLNFHWPRWLLWQSQICEHGEFSVLERTWSTIHPDVWSHSAVNISKLGLVQTRHMTKKGLCCSIHPNKGKS